MWKKILSFKNSKFENTKVTKTKMNKLGYFTKVKKTRTFELQLNIVKEEEEEEK